MPPEHDDLEALLRALREQTEPTANDDADPNAAAAAGSTDAAGDDPDLLWVWTAAAADPTEPASIAAFARIAGSRRAMLEFGIASAVLAERGAATAAGRASADRVLAALRRQRARRFRWLAGGTLAAAAALLLLLPRLWRSPEFAFELRDVAVVASRAGVDSVAFRVRLQSPTAWSPAVFLVEARPSGVTVDRVHPLDSALAASPAFRNWPGRELPAGAAAIVPPPPLNRLVFESGRGHVVIVTGPTSATEAWLDEVAAALSAALPATATAGLTAAQLEAATTALSARGANAQWRQLP